ncbi:DUF1801 domain-containing protein [Ensifer sp. T173]|jgi:hypothetical protein|uniref:DUF1801 domain-containing protein n=1 Tax=Ensifer canadensis TaxID=555315 RepID=A0AAW4FR55_9HYPH|nr:DUF1801 domain-containing protein [Ensifer canadensis]MBM3093819.1 DUF1801 domain-containing protein [Ensifer canadensis]UBI78196.1 DUF1801 domain-containing protein [Ensifer canadensis]
MDKRIEAFLADIRDRGDTQFAIVSRLREIALASGAGISEEIKYGGLLFSAARPFCGIFPYSAHVTLEFSEGAALPDAHGVLMGQGKARRHIKMHCLSDIAAKHVAAYVDLALRAAG